MLERVAHPNGVVIYQSPLLRAAGVRHGFSTRIGGVSAGIFESLNFGNSADQPQQDPQSHILENFQRLQQAIGCPSRTLRAWVRQVHGDYVELIEREPENEYAESLEAEIRDRFSGQLAADGLVSALPRVLLTVRTADCVPILLASEDGTIVAALHAGWRGVVTGEGVVARGIRVMHEAGGVRAIPEKLIAAIGPCISAEYFEVGEEVVAEFQIKKLADAIHPAAPGAKPHIDLTRAVQQQLERAGIQRIDTPQQCTFRDATEFFSHRREKGATGRMVAVIMAGQHT